jgi:carbon-monoxide dehydrogenase medium subunit
MRPPVAFRAAESVDQACALLAENDEARAVAGGTALAILLRQGLVRPELLVSVSRIPGLRDIEADGQLRQGPGLPGTQADGQLRLGAAVPLRVAEQHPLVRQGWPVLAETLRLVATPRIRNMATIGGGVAHADPAQDPPVTFVALQARMLVASATGQRSISADEFFVDYYETALRQGELLLGVEVPPLPSNARAVFLKYRPRSVEDYATVSAAAVVQLDEAGVCREARLVLGAVGSTPVTVPVAEALVGEPVTQARAREAAELARERVDPTDDVRGSAGYKREMAVVFARRAVLAAAAAPHPR